MTKIRSSSQIDAIILHKRRLPTGDVILTLLDRNLGKINALAKKVSLPTSHRSGYLEIGWHIMANCYKTKENDSFFILGRIEEAESFWHLLISLEQAGWFFRTLDLVNKNLGYNLPQPRLFDDLLSLLEALDIYSSLEEIPDPKAIQLTFHAFEAKLLNHLGYWPQEKILSQKWKKVIKFLLYKEPSDILVMSMNGNQVEFLNKLQLFLDQLHQSLIEYKPISPKFFEVKNDNKNT